MGGWSEGQMEGRGDEHFQLLSLLPQQGRSLLSVSLRPGGV